MTGPVNGQYTIQFVGALASTDVGQVTANGSGLSGSSPTATVTTAVNGNQFTGALTLGSTTGLNFGKVFAEWDREFLALLDRAPSSLARYTMADFARLGGEHSIEVVQWLAMRAALPEPSRMEFNYYYPYGLMGYAIAAFCPA